MLTSLIRNFFNLKPTRVSEADKKASIFLSIGIALTQFADYLSTKIGLTSGAVEGNGGMAKFIHEYGYTNFLYLKIAASAFLIWTCWKRPVASSFVVVLYIAVVINNLFVISRFIG